MTNQPIPWLKNTDKGVTICLLPLANQNIDLTDLTGKRYFGVKQILKKIDLGDGREAFTLLLEKACLEDPNADPLIMGVIYSPKRSDTQNSRHDTRIIWNNRAWRTADEDTCELFELLSGVKSEDIAKFADYLNGKGPVTTVRLTPPDIGK